MCRAALIARRAWTWFLRVVVSFWMHTGWLPTPLLREYLRWLHESMHPQHPGLPVVLAEIAEVEERCRG